MMMRKQYALMYDFPHDPQLVMVAVPEKVLRHWRHQDHQTVVSQIQSQTNLSSITALTIVHEMCANYNKAKKRRYQYLKQLEASIRP